MKTVYVFPNGFRKEAEGMCGWLRYYGFAPHWGPAPSNAPGGLSIEVPEDQVDCLCLMAKANPARFGNESEIRRRAGGDTRIGSIEYLEKGAW